MIHVPDVGLITDLFKETLETTVPPLKVGLAGPPAGDPPYIVLWAPTGTLSGLMNDPHADGQLVFRVVPTSRPLTGDAGEIATQQVQFWAKRIRDELLQPQGGLLATLLEDTGYGVAHVTLDNLGQVTRDDDTIPPFYYLSDPYRVYVTPATVAGS